MIRRKDREKDHEGVSKSGSKPEGRLLIDHSTKAAVHPTRSMILKNLKQAPHSTVELEEVTGETRYNLYHHLKTLEDVDLVQWEMGEGRKKIFSLKKPSRPEAAVLIFEEEDIRRKSNEFQALLRALERMEGEKIPHSKRVKRAEVCVYYEWG